MSEQAPRRRLAAILAADVVRYSGLMGADEAGTLAALKSRRTEILQPLVSRHHGRIIKIMGDGVLVEFASAVNAVECAIELQAGMEGANRNLPEDSRIVLRVGINVGDVMVEGSDLYGDGVNVAARLEAAAEAGGVFVSQTVFNHVNGKTKLRFEDLGDRSLKNMVEPVRVYRVLGPIAVGDEIAPSKNAISSKPSIAALPFTNMSGDPEQEYFSDGITEDIITELSRFRNLVVIARNSSFSYKGKPTKTETIARELGVQYVLEGSVRRAGQRIRVTAQLISAANDKHVWAERYDRELSDIFTVQDEIAHNIVGTMAVELEAESLEQARRKSPADVQAYEHWLRGMRALMSMGTGILEARQHFERAATVDPCYSRAHSGLADTYLAESAVRAACCMLWVTMTMQESVFSSSISSSTLEVEIGSSAEQGSSSRSTEGLTATPRAMHSRCCWPLERLRPLCFSLSLTSRPGAAPPRRGHPSRNRSLLVETDAEGDVVVDRHGKGRRLLEHHADAGPQQVQILLRREDVLAIEQDLARRPLLGIEVVDPVQDAEQGRLAAARGADEGGDLLVVQREADVLQRLMLVIEEIQIADADLLHQGLRVRDGLANACVEMLTVLGQRTCAKVLAGRRVAEAAAYAIAIEARDAELQSACRRRLARYQPHGHKGGCAQQRSSHGSLPRYDELPPRSLRCLTRGQASTRTRDKKS
jgi:TolB-like protein/class 3 adenylate cyclase